MACFSLSPPHRPRRPFALPCVPDPGAERQRGVSLSPPPFPRPGEGQGDVIGGHWERLSRQGLLRPTKGPDWALPFPVAIDGRFASVTAAGRGRRGGGGRGGTVAPGGGLSRPLSEPPPAPPPTFEISSGRRPGRRGSVNHESRPPRLDAGPPRVAEVALRLFTMRS